MKGLKMTFTSFVRRYPVIHRNGNLRDRVTGHSGPHHIGQSGDACVSTYRNIQPCTGTRHQNIGSTLTSVLGAMEPVTAVCVGIAIFGEPFTRSIALGILLIISAVTVIILKDDGVTR